MKPLFPEDSEERKTYPVYSGFLRYFPAAVAAVAHHSYLGNEKHNPGQSLHWDRAKSGDEADALCRHLMESEVAGYEHELVGMAWRAMADLQKYLESKGAPIAPAARNADGASLHEFLGELAADSQMLAALPPNLRDAVLLQSGVGDMSAAVEAQAAAAFAGRVHASDTSKEVGHVPRHPMAAEADRLKPGDGL